MRENVVRLADYRDAIRRRAVERGVAPAEEPVTVVVQGLPPDRALLNVPRSLWPALADWLSARGVQFEGSL